MNTDIVTINPDISSPSSHRLTSSSSSPSPSSGTASSASTVLLTSNKITSISTCPNVAKTSSNTNENHIKNNNNNNNKSISQLPKPTTTNTNVSRLKQPSKIVSLTNKLIPSTSSTITKPTKSMIVNSASTGITTMTTSAIRKPTGISNQSFPMTNNIVNKTTQEQVRIHIYTHI